MKKAFVAAAIGAAMMFGTVGFARAADEAGGFCKINEARIGNIGDAVVQKKLWEYTGAKIPEAPVMGWIDIACADRGEPRSVLQDLGKRVWFNVSGPAGASLDKGQLSVSDANLSGLEGDAGIAIRGLGIYGIITPKHECVYQVEVWQDHCDSH